MANIYYKNPQSNLFTQLTYKDFGAAAAYHTHTHEDIVIRKANTVPTQYIPQVLPISKGGTNNDNNININKTGIFAATMNTSKISRIATDNDGGVLGYFNRADNFPSFEIWPVTAGGTGCTNVEDVMNNFKIGVTNTDKIQYINWNSYHSVNAFLTNSRTRVIFSIILPFSLLPHTTGFLELYPIFMQQTSATTTTTYKRSNYIYGFTAPFSTDEYNTETNDCIYEYGWNNNGIAGHVDETSPQGNIVTYASGLGPVFDDNQQLLYYSTGNIITVYMNLKKIPPSNSEFANNYPLLISLGYGLNSLTNQIILPRKVV